MTNGEAGLREALRNLPVQEVGAGNSTWDDCEPTKYVLLSDLNAALAAPVQAEVGAGEPLERARAIVKRYNEAFIDQENNTPRPGLVRMIADALAARPDAATGEPGQAIADGILKRIALRYKNCMVNIYPDLPELTPVEGVLRCAREEGFVLVARPDVAGEALRSALAKIPSSVWGLYLNEQDQKVFDAWWLAAEPPAPVAVTGPECAECFEKEGSYKCLGH